MTLGNILFTILIKPLQIVFDMVFSLANLALNNYGLSIIALSLVINLLVLPLYRRADKMQEQQRDTERKLEPGVRHIRKTFRGDEQMMILQTFYRQNHYKPTDVVRGAVSLLLEIPFFIAAYRYLSEMSLLRGASFGPIADLGAPDGLLKIAGFTINLLPVIMTLVNLVSSYLFTRGYPLKSKIQLYAMALFFLVFLYDSPAGLVFYWTLNNVFSLIKTIFYKIKNPRKVICGLMAAGGAACLVFYSTYDFMIRKRLKTGVLLIGIGLLVLAAAAMLLMHLKKRRPVKEKQIKTNPGLYFAACAFLALLTGALIPSTVIVSSPQEFVIQGILSNPILYAVNSTCIAVGAFVVWFGVFYRLADDKWRSLMEKLVCAACAVVIVNYMLFPNSFGVLSNTLSFEDTIYFSGKAKLINLAVCGAAAVGFLLLMKLLRSHAKDVLVIGTLALCVMTVINGVNINKGIAQLNSTVSDQVDDSEITYRMSKNGRNVVVVMLDRAIGDLVPYIMNELPELREKFDGFTYYSNTASFGTQTIFAAPAVFGGYEYTPVEINKRGTEKMQEKNDEALKVLPAVFQANGYDVTVTDAPYAGYQETPDMSIFNDIPNIRAMHVMGVCKSENTDVYLERVYTKNMRNFFCYSVMCVMPTSIRSLLYSKGDYLSSQSANAVAGVSRAHGLSAGFDRSFTALDQIPARTEILEDGDTFLCMTSDITHAPTLLQEPEYEMREEVDNTEYDREHADRFEIDGHILHVDDTKQMTHYHANVAAYKVLAKWFDYLRENDLYDNTRIILVSDHGYGAKLNDELIRSKEELEGGSGSVDFGYLCPLLMVKDFNSTGFTVSDEFMTNADTPTIAVSGLVENPVNPYTGKTISSDEKTAHDQYAMITQESSLIMNSGYTFRPGDWYSIKDSIWENGTWKYAGHGIFPDALK